LGKVDKPVYDRIANKIKLNPKKMPRTHEGISSRMGAPPESGKALIAGKNVGVVVAVAEYPELAGDLVGFTVRCVVASTFVDVISGGLVAVFACVAVNATDIVGETVVDRVVAVFSGVSA
jgi:hypothetical protein